MPASRHQVGEQLSDDGRVGADVPPDEPQVLLDGEVAEDLAVLGDVADTVPHRPGDRPRADVVAGQLDETRPGSQAQHRLQRRRLADAVPAQERGDPGRGHLEGDALQRVQPAVAHMQVVHPQHGGSDGAGHNASPRYAC